MKNNIKKYRCLHCDKDGYQSVFQDSCTNCANEVRFPKLVKSGEVKNNFKMQRPYIKEIIFLSMTLALIIGIIVVVNAFKLL